MTEPATLLESKHAADRWAVLFRRALPECVDVEEAVIVANLAYESLPASVELAIEDDGGRMHDEKSGRFVEAVAAMRKAHPVEFASDDGITNEERIASRGMKSDEIKEKFPKLHAKQEVANASLERYHRGRLAESVERLLHEKPSKPVPLPSDDAPRSVRIGRAKKAISQAEDAAADFDYFCIYESKFSSVAGAHPEGSKAFEAAVAEAKRRSEEYLVNADAHVALLSEDQKKLAAKLVQKIRDGISAKLAIEDDKFSLDAFFAHDIHNRRAQGILNRSITVAKQISASARRDLEKSLQTGDQSQMWQALTSFIHTYRTKLADLLTTTQLASLLEGAREVAKNIPTVPAFPGAVPPPATLEPIKAVELLDRLEALPIAERDSAVYALPADQQAFVKQGLAARRHGGIVPPGPFTPRPPASGSAEPVHFPIIDEAARSLADRNVMTRAQFDALDNAARAKAFTVANVESTETLAKIRDALAENVADGTDLQAFREKVLSVVDEGTFLSPAHLETVFRTNVQTAFSDGQMTVLQHPFVRSGFPYAAYEAIDDDRVRHNHLALMTCGIQGTNIYRIDDPVFLTFRPPWDFCDRCSWIPMTVRMAASKGISEAVEWLRTGVEPADRAFVPMPPFRPPAGFQRSIAGMPLSVQLSMQPMDFDFGAMFAVKEAGHWITIGGSKGEDGERHGGSPVYVENGRITKGNPRLTGRKLDNLKEFPEESEQHKKLGELKADKSTDKKKIGRLNASISRDENAQEKSYQRAVWGKRARKVGLKPSQLHQLADEMKAHHDENVNDIKSMLNDARTHASKMGVPIHHKQLSETGDHTHIPGFDTMTRELSGRFPHLLVGDDAEKQEKLLDYLKDGNPESLAAEDAYQLAFDYLNEHGEKSESRRHSGKGKKKKAEYEDAVPFSIGFKEEDVNRDDHGRFAKQVGAIPHGELHHVGGLPVRHVVPKKERDWKPRKLTKGQQVHGRYSVPGLGESDFVGKITSIENDTAGGNFGQVSVKLDHPMKLGNDERSTVMLMVNAKGEFVEDNYTGLYKKTDDEFRIDTDEGHVSGDADKIASHIVDDHAKRKLHGKKREQALERAEGVAEADVLTDPEQHAADAKGFAALPKGAKVVSLDANTHGRVGEIVKGEDGSNRVKLEGTPGFASDHVEPLDEKHSWRTKTKVKLHKSLTLNRDAAKSFADTGEATAFRIHDAKKPLPKKSANMWTDADELMPGTSGHANFSNALEDMLLGVKESVTGENYTDPIKEAGSDPVIIALDGESIDGPGSEVIVPNAKIAHIFTETEATAAFREASKELLKPLGLTDPERLNTMSPREIAEEFGFDRKDKSSVMRDVERKMLASIGNPSDSLFADDDEKPKKKPAKVKHKKREIHGESLEADTNEFFQVKREQGRLFSMGFAMGVNAMFAQVHSPVGGVTIGGEFYPGGQWIPEDVIAKATKEEKAPINDSKTHMYKKFKTGELLEDSQDKTVIYTPGDVNPAIQGNDREFTQKYHAYASRHLDHERDEIEDLIGDEALPEEDKEEKIEAIRERVEGHVLEFFDAVSKHLRLTHGDELDFAGEDDFKEKMWQATGAVDEAANQQDVDVLYEAIADLQTEMQEAATEYTESVDAEREDHDEKTEAEDQSERDAIEGDYFDDIESEVESAVGDDADQDEIDRVWTETVRTCNKALADNGEERWRIGIAGDGSLEVVDAEDLDDEYKPRGPDAKLSVTKVRMKKPIIDKTEDERCVEYLQQLRGGKTDSKTENEREAEYLEQIRGALP